MVPAAYKLTYFDVQGIAEPIRFLLKYADIDFENETITFEEWAKTDIRTKMPFGLVPILTLQNGKVYHQSLAILRFFAKQAKLTGKDALEDLEIDAIVETVSDLKNKFVEFYWNPDVKVKEIKKQELFNQTVPFYFERLEKIAQDNQGHLACKRLTYADIYWAGILDYFNNLNEKKDLVATNYPNLAKVAKNVRELRGIKEWISERPQAIM